MNQRSSMVEGAAEEGGVDSIGETEDLTTKMTSYRTTR